MDTTYSHLPQVDQEWIAAAAARKAQLARDLNRAMTARKARLALIAELADAVKTYPVGHPCRPMGF